MIFGETGGATVSTSLRPSFFLNHPAFLPIVTGSMATVSSPAMGLFSGSNSTAPRPTFPQASSPGASNRMSPTSCPEETPCSSPTSFCSFSEASSPPLGGTMAEWFKVFDSGGRRGGTFSGAFKVWFNNLAFEPKPFLCLIHRSFQLSVSSCWNLSKPKKKKIHRLRGNRKREGEWKRWRGLRADKVFQTK